MCSLGSEATVDGPLKCFNPSKNWLLGWYEDRALNLGSGESWTGRLAAFVDYDMADRSENEFVLLRVDEFLFIQYNRAKRFNAGTSLHLDKVLVVVGRGGLSMLTSVLVAGLGNGERYSWKGSTTIEVCSLVFNITDYAELAVYPTGTPSTCNLAQTPNPASATSAPTPKPSPSAVMPTLPPIATMPPRPTSPAPTLFPSPSPTPRPTTAPPTPRPTNKPSLPPSTLAPVTSAPITPVPVSQAPITPSPVTPAPVTPAPATPVPVTPAPVPPAPGSQAPATQPRFPAPTVTLAPADLPLEYIGECSSDFPCARCQGDCDDDWDCTEGLRCYVRAHLETIVGCSGGGLSGTDYCFADPSLVASPPNNGPELEVVPQCSSTSPCGLCQGDCDNDDDCEGGLKCLQRGGFESVPGCSGLGRRGYDYCYPASLEPEPSSGPELIYTGECTSVGSCGVCEGDCDEDWNCGPGLSCFHRSGLERIPGCSGLGESGVDYCFRDPQVRASPPSDDPVLRYVGQCSSGSPCGVCEGDCDGDNDCGPGLRCIFRGSFESVPGCSGLGIRAADYCYPDASLLIFQ